MIKVFLFVGIMSLGKYDPVQSIKCAKKTKRVKVLVMMCSIPVRQHCWSHCSSALPQTFWLNRALSHCEEESRSELPELNKVISASACFMSGWNETIQTHKDTDVRQRCTDVFFKSQTRLSFWDMPILQYTTTISFFTVLAVTFIAYYNIVHAKATAINICVSRMIEVFHGGEHYELSPISAVILSSKEHFSVHLLVVLVFQLAIFLFWFIFREETQ